MLNIAIRADASTTIGTGHIMRCLTLANAIKEKHAAKIYFFCRQAEGNINQLILESGFDLITMATPDLSISGKLAHSAWLGATPEQDVEEFTNLATPILAKFEGLEKFDQVFDLVITDHYGIDAQWHQQIRNITRKVIVIDDLADRLHDCDYLLDQTFQCDKKRYQDKVPQHCQLLLGTKYALLRPEFNLANTLQYDHLAVVEKRTQRLSSIKDQRRLLIMFGGTDADNLTLQTLKLLTDSQNNQHIDIILGPSAKHIASVSRYCQSSEKLTLHIAPKNIAELMLNADFAIGAAGTTSWERCALGLPSFVVIQAKNQVEIARALSNTGAIESYQVDQLTFMVTQQLAQLTDDKLIKMSKACIKVCDGLGTNRLVSTIFANDIRSRPITKEE